MSTLLLKCQSTMNIGRPRILFWKVEKMSLKLPKCDFCKHYHEDAKKMCCDAFPDGIPLEKISADESEECRNGIKFEEDKD